MHHAQAAHDTELVLATKNPDRESGLLNHIFKRLVQRMVKISSVGPCPHEFRPRYQVWIGWYVMVCCNGEHPVALGAEDDVHQAIIVSIWGCNWSIAAHNGYS